MGPWLVSPWLHLLAALPENNRRASGKAVSQGVRGLARGIHHRRAMAALALRTLCKACACARSSRCDMCTDASAASTRSRNGELPIGMPPTVASATYAAALVSTSAALAAERGGGVRLRVYMRACNTVQCKAMQCRLAAVGRM